MLKTDVVTRLREALAKVEGRSPRLKLSLDPQSVAEALAYGTTTIRLADGGVERWRIDHFRPLADLISATLFALPALLDVVEAAVVVQDMIKFHYGSYIISHLHTDKFFDALNKIRYSDNSL